MSPNPTIRASHAHLHLPLSFPPGCIQAPRFCVYLYLAHPHSRMRLHNHIVSRKAAGESERGGRRWRVTGMRFSSNLVPQSPQLPRKKQGGQALVPVRLRAHLAADRSGRFTGCTFVHFWLTASALLFVCVCVCAARSSQIKFHFCHVLICSAWNTSQWRKRGIETTRWKITCVDITCWIAGSRTCVELFTAWCKGSFQPDLTLISLMYDHRVSRFWAETTDECSAIETGKRNRNKKPNVLRVWKKKGFNKLELYIIALHLTQLRRTAGERGLMIWHKH